MLRSAAEKSCEIYVNRLEAGYDPKTQHKFSPEFEKKIKKLERKANHPIVYRSLQRIASIILVCLIACSAWLTVDAEARAAFFGWVKEIYETYFVYRFEGSADYSNSTVARPLCPLLYFNDEGSLSPLTTTTLSFSSSVSLL